MSLWKGISVILTPVPRACEGIDHVTHQAALGSVPRSVKDPVTSNAVNVSGFLNVLTAAKDAGCKIVCLRFIFVCLWR